MDAIQIRKIVCDWIREDLDTGAKMLVGFYANKLVDRLSKPTAEGCRRTPGTIEHCIRCGETPVGVREKVIATGDIVKCIEVDCPIRVYPAAQGES